MVVVMATVEKEVRFVVVGGRWSLYGGWCFAFPGLFIGEAD